MTDCNMTGYQVATIIHCCFRPEVEVSVVRNEEEIYFGDAENVPANLYNLRVVHMEYDDYYDIFNVEVE